MTEKNTYRRIVRRERYRSRSASVVVALGLVSLASAYVGVESALAALGRPALLVTPQQGIDAINTPPVLVTAGAAVAMLVGVIVILIALTPGRRARHALPHDRLAVIVDDAVLAGALGRAARTAASVPADRVRTTISARRATVSVTPSSGIPVDKSAVETAARELADRLAPTPRVRVGVSVASSGVVGS